VLFNHICIPYNHSDCTPAIPVLYAIGAAI
jgi:hypothetical protein